MSKSDFEDLAALWREDPDPGERAELEQLAQKARRRGRVFDYADIAMVVLLVGGSVVAAFAARSTLLMAAAVLIIIATVWVTWKRRMIRQMSRSLNTADRSSFLESSIRSVRANLRRNLLTLITFPMIIPLAVLLKVGSRTGGDPQAMLAGLIQWAGSQRGIITLSVLAVLMAFFIRARRKQQAELVHLRELCDAYEDEARRDAEAEL